MVSTHLDLVRDPVQEDIAPAALSPVRDKGPSNAGVERDEAAVILPEVVLAQDLAVGAEVEALVGPLDDADVGVVGDQAGRVRLAVQDEYEVGGGMEALQQEELEVRPGVGRLRVGVRDQRAVGSAMLGASRINPVGPFRPGAP